MIRSRIAHVIVHVIAPLMLAALATGALREVLAQTTSISATPELQLFVSASASQLTVGDTLTLELELIASVSSAREGLQVARAMNQIEFDVLPRSIHLVDARLVRSRQAANVEGTSLHVFAREYLLIPTESGSVTIPSLHFHYDGQLHSTRPVPLSVIPRSEQAFANRVAVFQVSAEVLNRSGRVRTRRAGSAFLVAENAVVTSFHVVLDADRVQIRLPSGRSVRLTRVWTIDPKQDVAVLYIDPGIVREQALAPLAMAAYDAIDTDQTDHVFSYSSGWQTDKQVVTTGVLHTGIPQLLSHRSWSSTNPVRPGDSGGPLFLGDGTVIGVITAGSTNVTRGKILREEICVVSDPRPALTRILSSTQPIVLKTLFEAREFANNPYVVAQRLSTDLFTEIRRRSTADRRPELISRVRNLRTLVADDADPQLLYLTGFIHQLAGVPAQAAEIFASVLNRVEYHYPSSYMLALHHLRRREFVEANRYFNQVARFQPYLHLAQYGLARAAIGMRRYDDARTHLQSVLDFDASFTPAVVDLARIDLANNNRSHARLLYVRLAAHDKEWASRLRAMFDNPLLAPPSLDEIPLIPVAPLHVDEIE